MSAFSKELTLERLKEFLSFASISTDFKYRKELDKTARWLEIYLSSLGFNAETIPAKTAPLVYAEMKFDKDLPTLLIYSHYDVQPAEPLNEWTTPPFEPTTKSGYLIARGVSDSKGQLFAYIAGIGRMLNEKKKLPINIKFIIDGDEEGDGLALAEFLKKNPKKLSADWVIAAAGRMLGEGKPALCYGARGILPLEVEIFSNKGHVHSGTYGGSLPNPALVLSKILGGLAQAPVSIEQAVSRRSFDVHSLEAGYVGEGFQFVIPGKVRAKASFRLAEGDDAEVIAKRFIKTVRAGLPSGLEVKIKKFQAEPAVLLNRSSVIAKSATAALKLAFNSKKVGSYIDGGAVPALSHLQKISEEIIMVGFGQVDDNLHAPNEKLNLKNFWKGADFAEVLVKKLAGDKINR